MFKFFPFCKSKFNGNSILLLGAYAPSLFQENIFQIVKKKIKQKVWHVHRQNICASVKFCVKMNDFCGLCKRQKIYSEKPCFSIKFCRFYTCHMTSRFVVKQQCGHVACANFWFIFLTFRNMPKCILK
jgi:hypothetical protein